MHYHALWHSFEQAEVSRSVTRQRLPELLDAWQAWGQQYYGLCEHAQLCHGSRLLVQVYDRAIFQGVRFSTTKTEGK